MDVEMILYLIASAPLWAVLAGGVWVCFDFYVLDTLRDMKRDRD